MQTVLLHIADFEAIIITYFFHQGEAKSKVSGFFGITYKSSEEILLFKLQGRTIVPDPEYFVRDFNENPASILIMHDGIFQQIGYHNICQALIHGNDLFCV